MTITLTHPSAGPSSTPLALELPDDLEWTDEHSYSPVVQAVEHTTTGALIIDNYAKQAGRPITLQGAQDRAWVALSVVQTLRAWAQVPGLVLSLSLRGAAHSVVYDHARTALEAQPIMFFSDPAADDFYQIALRFIEV
jgi:hypothetical protein